MLILASASPRRTELLKQIVSDFKVIPSLYGEELGDLSPADYAMDCAKKKAQEVFERAASKKDIVLAADTVVVKNGRIYFKPKSEAEAKEMLLELSDSLHEVITGVCVLAANKALCECERSLVTFDILSEEEIDAYIKTGSPMDKAGAYGIQDGFISAKVKEISGGASNVIGLPVKLTENLLKKI